MKPNLKDLDKMLGGLHTRCGEGILADVCLWHEEFKKRLEERSDPLKPLELPLIPEFWDGYRKAIREILGEDTAKVSSTVRDRALGYHKSAIPDF